MTDLVSSNLDATTLSAIIDGRHADPFAVLGPHEEGGAVIIRAFVPAATRMEVIDSGTGASVARMTRVAEPGFFEVELRAKAGLVRISSARTATTAAAWEFDDPYRFGAVLGDIDDYLIREGTHQRLWERLGAHVDGTSAGAGRFLCSLGAQRVAGRGGWRLQRLGRTPASDAQPSRYRRLGDFHAGRRRQVRSTSSRSRPPTVRCCR